MCNLSHGAERIESPEAQKKNETYIRSENCQSRKADFALLVILESSSIEGKEKEGRKKARKREKEILIRKSVTRPMAA